MTMIEDFISTFLGGTVAVVGRVVGGAERLFGGGARKHSSVDRTNDVLFGPGGPPPATPPIPSPPGDAGDAGGLHDGAGQAGQTYGDNVTGASLTDEKLSELLKQIFTSNQNAREQVNAILADIQEKTKQIGPELGDPASLMSFHQYLDQKFGEIQKLLSDSQVDAKTQAAIMDALGQEYHTNSPKGGGDGSGSGDGDKDDVGSNSGGDGGSGGGDGGDDGYGAAGGGVGAGGGTDLMDPMAGMGPIGGMDPLASMLGPAMAGLGSVPGALGGLGGLGGSPLDALGPAMGSLGPAMAGARDSFGDKSGADHNNDNDFADRDGHKPDTDGAGSNSGDDRVKQPVSDANDPANTPAAEQTGATGPEPAPGTPAGAAPEGAPGQAPGDPQMTVDMPGGTPVTAPTSDRASAMRAVIGGSSVNAAFAGLNVNLPPPGTAVLVPVSRNDLLPGDYGQFSTKDPIMYMGNNKIWMDGQLQPISALQSSSDFLGWSAPPTSGGQQQQADVIAPPPVPIPPAGTV